MKVSELITNNWRNIAMEDNEIATYLETKTLKPTDTKGSRIKATWSMYYNPPISIIIAYDYALNNRENHYKAIESLVNKIGANFSDRYKYSGNMIVKNRGYMFLFDCNSEK